MDPLKLITSFIAPGILKNPSQLSKKTLKGLLKNRFDDVIPAVIRRMDADERKPEREKYARAAEYLLWKELFLQVPKLRDAASYLADAVRDAQDQDVVPLALSYVKEGEPAELLVTHVATATLEVMF